MKDEIIQSGSDGNATLINGSILVDCGVPYSKIKPYKDDLKLVLLTHAHSDHFRKATVRILAHQRPTLRWACCSWMVDLLVEQGVDKRNIDVAIPVNKLDYGWLGAVAPFEIHHNVKNCGWRIFIGDERVFYATDLGDLEGIEAKGYDLYLLEANHTKAEIEEAVERAQESGEFTYRIRAAENHLSYEQAMDWLAANMGPRSLWVPMHQHKEREVRDGRPPDAGEDDNRER